MAMNAELDKQISAVEQHADSVLQKQHAIATGGHASLVEPESTVVRARPTSSSSSAPGVTMSPRVHRAVRASAARNSTPIPSPGPDVSVAEQAALEKRTLNQQNQLKVQKLEIAQLKQEVAMTKEEAARLLKENKTAARERAAAQKSANELKRQLAKANKELEDVNALCQKLRAKNKDLDVQV